MRKFIIGLFLASLFGIITVALDLLLAHKPVLLENLDYGRVVLDAKGNILRIVLSKDDKYRLKINFDQIPHEVISLLLHYEDKFFYYHPGVNLFALLRSSFSTLTGQRKFGASTVTMQVARMAYGLKTDTIIGKLEQIRKALLL